MSNIEIRERVCACPHCYSDNALISGDLDPHTMITCSHCGKIIGIVADMRDAFVSLDRSEAGFHFVAPQTSPIAVTAS